MLRPLVFFPPTQCIPTKKDTSFTDLASETSLAEAVLTGGNEDFSWDIRMGPLLYGNVKIQLILRHIEHWCETNFVILLTFSSRWWWRSLGNNIIFETSSITWYLETELPEKERIKFCFLQASSLLQALTSVVTRDWRSSSKSWAKQLARRKKDRGNRQRWRGMGWRAARFSWNKLNKKWRCGLLCGPTMI